MNLDRIVGYVLREELAEARLQEGDVPALLAEAAQLLERPRGTWGLPQDQRGWIVAGVAVSILRVMGAAAKSQDVATAALHTALLDRARVAPPHEEATWR